jgi:GYF domain 2
MDQWFYIHLGRTYGPVASDELRNLAANGGLAPPDPIWRQDVPPSAAVPAGSVLVFFLAGGKPTPQAAPPLAFPPSAPAPEWLRDLIDGGETAEAASPVAAVPPPDWLQDIAGAEPISHPLKRKPPPS